MHTIIQTLFNNLTFLTTALFFGNLILKLVDRKFGKTKWATPLTGGLFSGLIGVAMMTYFSINIHSGGNSLIVDFRQLAILFSVYYGGGWAGLIAAAIMGVYRLFIGSFQFSSWIGLANIMFTYILAATMMRYGKRVSLWVWVRALVGALLIYLIAVTIVGALLRAYTLHALFGLFFIMAGMFAYYILWYLRRADDNLVVMRDAANHDFLTKLYNPRSFDRLFRLTTAQAEEREESFALLVVDIDHFKHVNDQYGHLNGDIVLVQVAQLLNDTVQQHGYCARKGGEEFAAILNLSTQYDALQMAEQVRERIDQHVFRLDGGHQIHLTVSIGVSLYPQHVPHQMFHEADKALYYAKEHGRNRVCLSTDLKAV
ncbi:diguanylate cyclase [Paenibacillus hunanensis]|uniref:GGDEF domain-containing protein n=1 Tax=Paenibacillus hunanensis TaxID=539262 RepID=UPI002A6A5AD0|nr:diguanylate cyclase [Paenibacillus hunanensis]WPP42758.1 diguanylate cyclase [Paenibacillus hunanensis]